MDPPPDYIRIVIDKAHRLIIVKCAVVLYIPDDHFSRISRAIDQNPPAAAELVRGAEVPVQLGQQRAIANRVFDGHAFILAEPILYEVDQRKSRAVVVAAD